VRARPSWFRSDPDRLSKRVSRLSERDVHTGYHSPLAVVSSVRAGRHSCRPPTTEPRTADGRRSTKETDTGCVQNAPSILNSAAESDSHVPAEVLFFPETDTDRSLAMGSWAIG
jgi:hypothetical protein